MKSARRNNVPLKDGAVARFSSLGPRAFLSPLTEQLCVPPVCCSSALRAQYSKRWGVGAERSLLGGFGAIAKETDDFTEVPISLHCLLLFEHSTRTRKKKISRGRLGSFRVHWLSRGAKLQAVMRCSKIPVERSSPFPRGLETSFLLQSQR